MIKNKLRPLYYYLKKAKIKASKQFKLSKIYSLSNKLEKELFQYNHSLEIIVFSKDRPMQLLALLESLNEYATPKIRPHIIYNAKNAEYESAYNELFKNAPHLYQSISNDSESGFKSTLVNLLDNMNSKLITFFVDDIFLKEEINWNEVTQFDPSKVIPSLRLGTHLIKCYTTNDQQILPPFKKIGRFNLWCWKEGEHDWNYPLSVDGNIFSRTEFLDLIKNMNFKAPNTLEINLQQFRKFFNSRWGVCFDHSIIVNNPINIVQTEFFNLHGKIHQDELLTLWLRGKKFDYKAYKNILNESCHQELELVFK